MKNTKNEQQCAIHDVSNSGGVNELICPKCKTGRDLKYKRYFMFGKVCGNCGSYVKLPTHPNYVK